MKIPRIGDWMQTYTGLQFWPLDPLPHEIQIRDIAHSLSLQCRFAGHVKEFYSVAQHSVLVSYNVPEEDGLWGLMHDASEAYLVDLPRPVKNVGELGFIYKQVEKQLMERICNRFNMDIIEPPSVKIVDNRLLMTEKRDLMGKSPGVWTTEGIDPFPFHLKGIDSESAEAGFLRRFKELGGPHYDN